MMVNGETEVYGILADPIHHVTAPELINDSFRSNHENKILIPFHVDEKSLKRVLEGLKNTENFKGAVITMPHKTSFVNLLDDTTEEVLQVNACNVIKRTRKGALIGDMLDGEGFVKGLTESNFNVRDKTAFLIGAGGAASGIAFALCKNGIKHLSIYNRTKRKADVLMKSLNEVYPEITIDFSEKIKEEIDLLINATSMGMKDTDTLPISLEGLTKDTLVAEVIIKPEITITLKEALAKGCKIHTGIHMLKHQIELMIAFMSEEHKKEDF